MYALKNSDADNHFSMSIIITDDLTAMAVIEMIL